MTGGVSKTRSVWSEEREGTRVDLSRVKSKKQQRGSYYEGVHRRIEEGNEISAETSLRWSSFSV